MKEIVVIAEDQEIELYGIQKDKITLKEMEEIIVGSLGRIFLNKAVNAAEQSGISQMIDREILNEIEAARNVVSNRS